MDRRLGLRDIRPLAGSAGQERFGLLDRMGGPAAVLALQTHGGSPLLAEAVAVLLDSLTDALPECPVQFLLSRRPLDPARLLVPWREQVEQRLGESAAARRAWDDLHAAYLPRLQAAGLADLWAGVAVAAPDAEQLAGRVAALFTALPYDAAPLTARELSTLIKRLAPPEAAGPTWYWQLTPPFPRVPGGWVRRLLEFPDLLPYAYDVAVHLRPATEEPLRAVLDQRQARLEDELRRRGGPPPGPPPPGAPAQAADTWLLELERQEVVARRAALIGGRERLREAAVLLALHLPLSETADTRGRARDADPRVAAFDRALYAAELVSHPLDARAAQRQAERALLPLADPAGLRAFSLPARQAADLAALAVSRPPDAGPALGLTPERTLFRYAPPGGDVAGHRILAGGGAAARRAAARQWALQSYLAGADVLIWDPARAWADWVAALGGRYVQIGGSLPDDRINLLAAPLPALNRPAFFDTWVREIADLFGLLLPPLGGVDADAVRSQIGAALLQVAMRSLERDDAASLSLATLRAELRTGGYTAVAGLDRIAAGSAASLFSPPGDAGAAPSLVVLGPPAGRASRPARRAAQIALRHALWPASPLFGAPRAPGRPLVVLLDGTTEALQYAPLVTDLLALAADAAAGRALWLLPGDAELAPLLGHRVGRALVRPLPLTVLFGPAAGVTPGAAMPPPVPGLDALVALAGIAAPAAARLPLLPPDQVLVALSGASWVLEIVTGDLARRET